VCRLRTRSSLELPNSPHVLTTHPHTSLIRPSGFIYGRVNLVTQNAYAYANANASTRFTQVSIAAGSTLFTLLRVSIRMPTHHTSTHFTQVSIAAGSTLFTLLRVSIRMPTHHTSTHLTQVSIAAGSTLFTFLRVSISHSPDSRRHPSAASRDSQPLTSIDGQNNDMFTRINSSAVISSVSVLAALVCIPAAPPNPKQTRRSLVVANRVELLSSRDRRLVAIGGQRLGHTWPALGHQQSALRQPWPAFGLFVLVVT
jgi:hypothetical protein